MNTKNTKKIVIFAILFTLAVMLGSCSKFNINGGNNATTDVSSLSKDSNSLITEKLSSEKEYVFELLSPSDTVAVPENFQKAFVGDTKLFLLGIYNIEPADRWYKIEISPIKAYDKFANKIDTDKTIDSWFYNNKQAPFLVKSSTKDVVPVVFYVGNYTRNVKNTAVPTEPGTYVFSVKVYSGDENSSIQQLYSAKELSIMVDKKQENALTNKTSINMKEKQTTLLQTLNLIAISLAIMGVVTGWIFKYSKSRRASKYLKRINLIYDEYKNDSSRCRKELSALKEKVEDDYADGRITNNTFTIIDKRIDNYISRTRKGKNG